MERLTSGRRPIRRNALIDAEEPQYERLEIELRLGSTDLLLDPATGRPQSGGPVATEREERA